MLTNLSGDTATRWVKDTSREAIINVDGKIESANDVSIHADSIISFTEGSKWNVVTQSKILESFLGNIGVDVMADGVKRSNKATINIGKTADIINGKLEADSTMSIAANAETELSNTAKSSTQLESENMKDQLDGSSSVPEDHNFIAVGVIDSETKANVNIKKYSPNCPARSFWRRSALTLPKKHKKHCGHRD